MTGPPAGAPIGVTKPLDKTTPLVIGKEVANAVKIPLELPSPTYVAEMTSTPGPTNSWAICMAVAPVLTEN